MTNVAILGASGYTSVELIKILLRHPHVKIVAATTREKDQPPISTLHPSLTQRLDLACEEFDPDRLAGRIECAFGCLPHGASMAAAAPLLERGIRVVDLSADYRLKDPNVYAEWYGHAHADTDNLKHAVYGLSEIYGEDIPTARLIANPGCYPTTAILGLAPLLAGKYVHTAGIVVDSKSGISGAGRTPKLTTHFPECNESVSAYNVGRHRHTPEIEQVVSDVAGEKIELTFTPHLIPMDRGMFSTIYSRLVRPIEEKELLAAYSGFYARKPFVRIVDHLPATKDTVDSNFIDITVRVVRDQAVVLVAQDNLIKGASGAAVQNFNLMFGYPETTALL